MLEKRFTRYGADGSVKQVWVAISPNELGFTIREDGQQLSKTLSLDSYQTLSHGQNTSIWSKHTVSFFCCGNAALQMDDDISFSLIFSSGSVDLKAESFPAFKNYVSNWNHFVQRYSCIFTLSVNFRRKSVSGATVNDLLVEQQQLDATKEARARAARESAISEKWAKKREEVQRKYSSVSKSRTPNRF